MMKLKYTILFFCCVINFIQSQFSFDSVILKNNFLKETCAQFQKYRIQILYTPVINGVPSKQTFTFNSNPINNTIELKNIKFMMINTVPTEPYSLLKLAKETFIQTLRTPIIKAINNKKTFEFFTEQDYNKWKDLTSGSSKYTIKYFKGLGTSEKNDAKETFKRFDELKIDYYYKNSTCDDSIILAFGKDHSNTKAGGGQTVHKASDLRKEWLKKYDRDLYIRSDTKRVSYQDLINKELVHFSIYDNMRSIPNLCDGLKPSQRKILYYLLCNSSKKYIKVAQLSGFVSAKTVYHHGETSLQQAIIGMAQDFIGTNNINLLLPLGTFGSRFELGKDAASPRYIHTELNSISMSIFDQRDNQLLNYRSEDGVVAEPEWYLPIIPMILVNGCEGIGTGYSTYIPPHNPLDIIDNLRFLIKDTATKLPKLKPFFKNFRGDIKRDDTKTHTFFTVGKWKRVSSTRIHITEIPVGTGVTGYKEFLDSLIETNLKTEMTKNGKTTKKVNKVVLKDVKNNTKDENTGIEFIVDFKTSECLDNLIETETLEKELKLIKSFNTNNMYLFNETLEITKYNKANDILRYYYNLRIEMYCKRKKVILKDLEYEMEILKNKIRFINEYIDETIKIHRKTRDYILDTLEKRGYKKIQSKNTGDLSFDYLINIPLISMSKEKIDELERQFKQKQSQLNELRSLSPQDLYLIDLKDLEDHIKKQK